MKSQTNTLSIVIPVFNRAGLILKTLDSILAQYTAPSQVIVVDNGSTDGTRQSVEKWKQAHTPLPFEFITAEEKTPGACAARNHGAKLASGNLLLFFDSDDTMRPLLVSKIMENFSDAETKIVYWKRLLHDLHGKERVTKWSSSPTLNMQIYHSLFNTINYAMRKELFTMVGGWNEQLPCWNDWEIGIRLYLHAGENAIRGVNEILVDGYLQETSITGTGFLTKAGNWEKAIEAARYNAFMLPEKKSKQFLRSLALKEAVLAAHYRREGGKKHAEETMKKLLAENSDNLPLQLVLKCAYRYTAFGLRGIYSILG